MLYYLYYNKLDLIQRCDIEKLKKILVRFDCAKYTAQWFLRTGALKQFRVAKEIKEEKTEDFRPFEMVEDWE
jgi:hypothetical protein